MTTPSDDTDIIGMLRDDLKREDGFRLLMQRYGDTLYWYIRRIVVGHDDAEDVLQETAMSIFCHFGQFRGEAPQFKTWLYRVATNESIQLLRQRTRFFQSIDSLSPSLEETLKAENPVDGDKAGMLLQQALLTLPTQQRIAFNMRYFDEMTYEEIAQVTGKNVNTLKANYHFAREKVDKYIKGQIE